MPKKSKGVPYEGYQKLNRVITVKTNRFLTNRLLQRKQMVCVYPKYQLDAQQKKKKIH